MATTIRLFQKKSLPDTGYPLRSLEQLQLLNDTATTEIERVGACADPKYVKYRIKHAHPYRMEGQVNGQPFSRCLRFATFPSYASTERDWVLTAGTSGDTAARAFKRLKGASPHPFHVEPVKLDLNATKARIKASNYQINGGWFGGLKIDGVDVAFIMGGGVTESNEWEKYEQYGRLGSLNFTIPYNGIKLQALITKDATIMLLQNLSEKLYLDLATGIYGFLFPDPNP